MSISRTSALIACERAKRNGYSVRGIAAEVNCDRDKLRRFLMGVGVEDEQRLVARLCEFGARLADAKRPLAAERVIAKEGRD